MQLLEISPYEPRQNYGGSLPLLKTSSATWQEQICHGWKLPYRFRLRKGSGLLLPRNTGKFGQVIFTPLGVCK